MRASISSTEDAPRAGGSGSQTPQKQPPQAVGRGRRGRKTGGSSSLQQQETSTHPPLQRTIGSPVSMRPPIQRTIGPVSMRPPIQRTIGPVSMRPPIQRTIGSPVSMRPPLQRNISSPLTPPLQRTISSPLTPPLQRTIGSPLTPPLQRTIGSPVRPPHVTTPEGDSTPGCSGQQGLWRQQQQAKRPRSSQGLSRQLPSSGRQMYEDSYVASR